MPLTKDRRSNLTGGATRMGMDTNRLLLELEQTIRTLNREIINPEIPSLTLDGLCPVMCMVATTRAAYLNELFHTATEVGRNIPSTEQVTKLRALRETYEEMVSGAQALETAIQRGYLDVSEGRKKQAS